MRIAAGRLCRSSPGWVTASLAVVLFATSCSSGDGHSSGPGNSVILSPGADKLQEEILADGVVTLAELTEAQAAASDCMEQQGVTSRFKPDDRGGFTNIAGDSTGSLNDAKVTSIIDGCTQKYTNDVAFAYSQTVSASQTPAERAFPCLLGTKLIPAGSTIEAAEKFVRDHPDQAAGCLGG